MTDDKNITEPLQNVPTHKSYYCPHCKKIIMKGNVKRLSMTCPHCSELIDADEAELLISESNGNKK